MEQQIARAVSEAVSEALGTQLLPVLSRRIGKIPEIVWRLVSDDDSAWTIDGLGPVRVSGQIALRDYGEIREFIAELARMFGGERIRDVRPPFPDREVRNLETTVVIKGIPVTVWGTTASPTH